MTFDIPREKWTEFLNDFSKRRYGWETKVEVVSESLGDQILSKGLPLIGVACDAHHGKTAIEILTGETVEHQTHTIADPTSVAYLDEPGGYRGILEIEEADGTKTLVALIDPMPVHLGYAAYKIVAAS